MYKQIHHHSGAWMTKHYHTGCIVLVLSLCMAFVFVSGSSLNPVTRTTYGVAPDLLERYIQKTEKQQFQCLQSKEWITFDAVNDNYCDCKDGSDEPGTSACSNSVLSFNADIKFYCRNKHFKPKYISHSKVNE